MLRKESEGSPLEGGRSAGRHEPTEAPFYRTTDWRACEAALRERGSLTVWFDPAMDWHAEPLGKRGGRAVYSDAAIQACLTIKVLFGLPLRVLSRRWWGSGRRALRRGEVARSRFEIDRAIGEGRAERLPAVELAHRDWPGGRQRPEQHGRGLGLGQDGSRVLMRRRNCSCGRRVAFVVLADFHWPGGSRVKSLPRTRSGARRRSPFGGLARPHRGHGPPLTLQAVGHDEPCRAIGPSDNVGPSDNGECASAAPCARTPCAEPAPRPRSRRGSCRGGPR